MTKSAKIKAVNRVFSLVKNGVNITDARQTVATELGLSAGSTVWNWQRLLKMKTPVINITRTNNTARISSTGNANTGLATVNSQLTNVLTSLHNKDGKYTTREAGAMSQLSNNIIGIAKLHLEAHKYADKASKRNIVVNKLLG